MRERLCEVFRENASVVISGQKWTSEDKRLRRVELAHATIFLAEFHILFYQPVEFMALKPNNLHILCVDDEPVLLHVMSQLLTRRGHVVTSRTDSLNGLRVFSEEPYGFDIAILEARMAHLTGFELAQRFRLIRPGFPVILYGAYIDSSLGQVAEEAGICCCEKPATLRELETTIREALQR